MAETFFVWGGEDNLNTREKLLIPNLSFILSQSLKNATHRVQQNLL